VVCTHLHVDHVGWNTKLEDGARVPTVPNARYVLGKTEFAHWSAGGDEEQQEILWDSVQPILDAGLAEFVEMDHRISPHLRLAPRTGHTPGHVSVMIESEGESAVITGDMSHYPARWPIPTGLPRSTATQGRRQRPARDCLPNGPTSRSRSSAFTTRRRRRDTCCGRAPGSDSMPRRWTDSSVTSGESDSLENDIGWSSMDDLVLRADRAGICQLTLNRPDKLNALNVDLFKALD